MEGTGNAAARDRPADNVASRCNVYLLDLLKSPCFNCHLPPSWSEFRYVEVRNCCQIYGIEERRRRNMREIWWWVTGRSFAENMFFPVGWPRVLNTCEQGKINTVVCNRDKIMFAVLTADSLVIWYCKARNLGQESAFIQYSLRQYCCNVAMLLQYCWNDLYCTGFS